MIEVFASKCWTLQYPSPQQTHQLDYVKLFFSGVMIENVVREEQVHGVSSGWKACITHKLKKPGKKFEM